MDLGYTRWGEGKTQAKLLFLHGMGGTGALWRPVAASLEDDFDILAPDQRGHGRSIVADVAGGRTRIGYTPLDYGRDVVELMTSLNFHPAFMIGHSMGVRTACAAAHLRPDWVRGLILVDLGFSGAAGGGLGEGLAHFLTILPMHFNSRNEARDFMTKNCPDPAIAQYLMAVSVPTADGGLTFPFDRAALIQTIHSARDASVRTWVRALGSGGMPILVLRGAKSLVWSHEEYEAERTAYANLPSVRFEEIPNAGHGLPFEQRLAFVERLKAFLNEA